MLSKSEKDTPCQSPSSGAGIASQSSNENNTSMKSKQVDVYINEIPNHETNAIPDIETSTPVEIVKVEVVNSKAFSSSSFFSTFLTILAIIVSMWPVREMVKDRNAAYSPDILINPIEISHSWDAEGNESWLVKTPEMESPFDDDDRLFDLKQSTLGIYANYWHPVVNIGVGAAKEVVFHWDSENLKRLDNLLVKCDTSKKGFCDVKNNCLTFNEGENTVIAKKEYASELMYMLPAGETGETYSLSLPVPYITLIKEIIKTNQSEVIDKYKPLLLLEVSGTNIHGTSFQKSFEITLTLRSLIITVDGYNEAVYQLIPSVCK